MQTSLSILKTLAIKYNSYLGILDCTANNGQQCQITEGKQEKTERMHTHQLNETTDNRSSNPNTSGNPM